jgi:hypothetical protein
LNILKRTKEDYIWRLICNDSVTKGAIQKDKFSAEYAEPEHFAGAGIFPATYVNSCKILHTQTPHFHGIFLDDLFFIRNILQSETF